jgi:hypothetical protein
MKCLFLNPTKIRQNAVCFKQFWVNLSYAGKLRKRVGNNEFILLGTQVYWVLMRSGSYVKLAGERMARPTSSIFAL